MIVLRNLIAIFVTILIGMYDVEYLYNVYFNKYIYKISFTHYKLIVGT
jgi:hypothetical protein